MSIGNCDCCDRCDVPGHVVRSCPGEPFVCFICQGDDFDPYGEMEADERVVLCEACGSEGELIYWDGRCDNYGNPMARSEPCPCCEGTGGEIIRTEPVTLDDLDQLTNEIAVPVIGHPGTV